MPPVPDPLLMICRHLSKLRAAMKPFRPVTAGDPPDPRIYRVERIRQNLRLDLPSLRSGGSFVDRAGYPTLYPRNCGPNVPPTREDRLRTELARQLPALHQTVKDMDRSKANRVFNAATTYVGQIGDLWTKAGASINDPDNRDNCATTGLPKLLGRYVSLRDFIKYGLCDERSPLAFATKTEAETFFLEDLLSEKNSPGLAWAKLARIWHRARAMIEGDEFQFYLPSKNNVPAVKFFGEGSRPLHEGRGKSPNTLRRIVRELALPGWEIPKQRRENLGLVFISYPSAGVCAYRPTILDTLGNYAYFFLPSSQGDCKGKTWRLTDCLRYNSATDHDGQPEWTVEVPGGGIPFQHRDAIGTWRPSFELAALSYGTHHAKLFNP